MNFNSTDRNHSRNRKSGMTLFEIILVIALIALIGGLAIGNLDQIFGQNQVGITETKVKTSFKLPLNSYRMNMGSFPSTAQGLKALLTAPDNNRGRWKGPYLEDEDNLLDPWGNPLQYQFPGTHKKGSYDLYSFGPDGIQSGDDITNW